MGDIVEMTPRCSICGNDSEWEISDSITDEQWLRQEPIRTFACSACLPEVLRTRQVVDSVVTEIL